MAAPSLSRGGCRRHLTSARRPSFPHLPPSVLSSAPLLPAPIPPMDAAPSLSSLPLAAMELAPAQVRLPLLPLSLLAAGVPSPVRWTAAASFSSLAFVPAPASSHHYTTESNRVLLIYLLSSVSPLVSSMVSAPRALFTSPLAAASTGSRFASPTIAPLVSYNWIV